ncbi:MAG TPA: response regulator [Gemmatimonadaceae bacterium]|nr:response regulator [Gemmatimonadaceae bacterium]
MTDVGSAKVSTGLATVWEHFREATLKRVDLIEDAAIALLEGRLSPDHRRQAEREAGKLAGSAGTFGFPRSSQIAREIEKKLSGESSAQLDAVFISEQLLALRADLEGIPQALSAGSEAFEGGDSPVLLLVKVEDTLAERIATDGEARGLRILSSSSPDAARSMLATEQVSAVLVGLGAANDDGDVLAFLAELGARDPPLPSMVITHRHTFADRLEVARRGARKFIDHATPPRAIVDAAMVVLRETRGASATILAVDDNTQILGLLETLLRRRRMQVVTLSDPLRFWDVLEETNPDLVILDLEMPHINGHELCRVMRNDRHWSQLPVVFLTGHGDPANFQKAFAVGGDDIVLKPFAGFELITRVENRLQRARIEQETADIDELTGLANPRRATETMGRFLRLARRKSDPYCIAAVEIDRFSKLSERYGRSAVDAVVSSFAHLLTQSFRAEDVIGRWSEGEFAVGMYGSTKEQAVVKLTRLFGELQQQKFAGDGREAFHASASAGVSQYLVDGASVEELHKSASAALSQAKSIGVNQVIEAGAPVPESATSQVDVALVDDDEALVGLLRHAMESRGLKVAIFADGEAAATALTGNVPEVRASIILLGVDLPALNGLEVLRRLNLVGVTKSSNVVMLTARAGESDVLSAFELGAVDHIAKPFSVPVLMHKVRSLVRQTRE